MRKLSLLVTALLLLPAVSQAETLDELLVEKGVIAKGNHDGSDGAGASKVYYSGGTKFEFPDTGFTSKINVQLQPRYEYTDNETGSENTSSFRTRRARLQVSGTALNKEFDYKLQVDFVGDSRDDGTSGSELLDAYITWHACDWAWVRLGQFKTAISRQFNNSSTSLQFADRSFTSEYYDFDRQNGAAAGGEWEGVTWTAQITNGDSTGEGRNAPGVDTKHAGFLRVGYASDNMNVLEEGDVQGTEDHAWGVGFAYGHSADEVGGPDTLESDVISADLSYKYQGLSFAGEYYHASADDNGSIDISDDGFYAQVGYFLMPSEFEVAARYSLVSYDESFALDQTSETSVSLNYYWWAHSLKAQIGYVHQTDDPNSGEDVDTNRWLLQLSSWF